ncbi:alpha/beta fold hydrolase [Sphingobium aromaticivastans]|uniref:alpha/beta fold hydrolase n=1 Tax=Sphingobium aromaticivastans TaxID=1778665 RepID=UPI00301950E3
MTNPIRKAYVDIDEGQIHYRLREGDGTPLLFLHQTASSSAMWEKVMARWPGGQPLYAIDTPGFGGSFDPEGAPDMARYRDWTAQIMDALGLSRAHLVGHHTGSAIALALAAAQPDRAASLAMIGASLLTPAEREAFGRKLGHAFPPNRSGAYLLKNWEYLRVGGADQDMALLHREMIDMLRAWAARPHAYGAVWAQDAGPLMQAIACPAVAITARDDILFPYLDRIAELRPDIPRVVLEKGSNFEPDLAPDALVDALADHIARAESAG